MILIKFKKHFPFKGFFSINWFGTFYIRKLYESLWNRYPLWFRNKTINHESIHSAQALDFCKNKFIGYCIFYIVYALMWIKEILLPPYNKAYKDIRFEREAYANENNMKYLDTRKRFEWTDEKYDKNNYYNHE